MLLLYPGNSAVLADEYGQGRVALLASIVDSVKLAFYDALVGVLIVISELHGVLLVIVNVVHGVYQIIGNLTAKPRSKLIAKIGIVENSPIDIWSRRVITFILVCLAWMIFRANSFSDLGVLFKTLFTGWGGVSIAASLDSLGLSVVNLVTIVLSVIVLKQLDLQINTRPDLDNSALSISPSRSVVYVAISWIVAVAWIILLASNAESAFIYFQF